MRRKAWRAALGGLLAALLATGTELGARAQVAASTGAASIGDLERVRAAVEAPLAREAIARVAYAEAAGQGDSGLAGVVYTILNRAACGRWGWTIDQVVNARAQFEPVMRAGGDWRALPAASPAQRARIDTILNLALDGRLPDMTGGALWFQNPRVVAGRAAAGTVAPRLVHFGGSAPSAVIGDHAFYAQVAGAAPHAPSPSPPPAPSGRDVIVGAATAAPMFNASPMSHDDNRGLFVLADGSIVEDITRPR